MIFQAWCLAMALRAHALAWWAFQPGHQVVCQACSRAKIECGCFIAILRMGQSAQRWTFSMRNALLDVAEFGIEFDCGFHFEISFNFLELIFAH